MGKGPKRPDPEAANQAAKAVNEKTAFQKIMEQRFAQYNDWDTGTGAYAGQAKDITKAPGMDNYLDIYGNANAEAARSRIGDPSHAFTANLPGFNNILEKQKQMAMYDTRAQGLHDALSGIRSEAYGQGQYASEADVQRRNAYYAAAQQNENSYWQNKPKPLWQTIAGIAVGGLGALGTAGGAGGVRGLFGGAS